MTNSFYCPGEEAAMVIIVVSLTFAAYLCGSLIVCRWKWKLIFIGNMQNKNNCFIKHVLQQKNFIVTEMLSPYNFNFTFVHYDLNIDGLIKIG